ncbi:kynureninase [Cytophagaceae bacterium ABcell3]|nr:kynureninase [Cytophagaceae bacterium ABcell3]
MQDNLEYARSLDDADELKHFREKFHIPYLDDRPCIYFCGNSLGLQPIMAEEFLQTEMDDWKNLGVEGHLHASNPWLTYHKLLSPALANLCGADTQEVVAMNGLTVNLHLLLSSFYRPNKQRFKIITEANAFSSDLYALQSQLEFHEVDIENGLVTIQPQDGFLISEKDILDAIDHHKNELALVFFGGVNYQSGQVLDMQKITKAAHEAGALAGFDLAHAIGNIKLDLHTWQVDFAAWCSYKYLNSGPGGTAGVFIHNRHLNGKLKPAFRGWWGHREEDRFQMHDQFIQAPGADAWQLSNAPILSMAVQRASLQLFQEAGMDRIIEKSHSLTAYLEFLIKNLHNPDAQFGIEILTPPKSRGCQLSLKISGGAEALFEHMNRAGIMCDLRRPDIIRLAPVPLYNSYTEVYAVAQFLKKHCTYEK